MYAFSVRVEENVLDLIKDKEHFSRSNDSKSCAYHTLSVVCLKLSFIQTLISRYNIWKDNKTHCSSCKEGSCTNRHIKSKRTLIQTGKTVLTLARPSVDFFDITRDSRIKLIFLPNRFQLYFVSWYVWFLRNSCANYERENDFYRSLPIFVRKFYCDTRSYFCIKIHFVIIIIILMQLSSQLYNCRHNYIIVIMNIRGK